MFLKRNEKTTILLRIFTLLLLPVISNSYTISGIIYNTFDRAPIIGASIQLKIPGTDQTVQSTFSQALGRYSLSYNPPQPNQVFQVAVSIQGRWASQATIALSYDYTDFDFPLLAIRSEMNMEFIVYWGASPKDLNLYLFTPWSCNVSYISKNCQNGNAKGSFGYQDSDGWGPESIVLTGATDGRYELWINLVSTSSEVFAPATVKIPEVWVASKVGTGLSLPSRIPATSLTVDPAYIWWRAVRVDIIGSSIQLSYPNTVHTTKPVYPFLPDTTPTTARITTTTTTTTTSTSTSTSSSSSTTTTNSGSTPITTTSTSNSQQPSVTTSDQMPGTETTTTTTASTDSSSGTSSPSSSPPPVGTPGGNPGGILNVSAPLNVAGCSSDEARYCQIVLNDCSDAGQNEAKLCGCYSDLGFCLTGYGCFDTYQFGFEDECKKSCGEELCSQFGDGVSLDVNRKLIALAIFSLFLLSKSRRCSYE